MDYVELVQFSANDTAVHFTFRLRIRHHYLQWNISTARSLRRWMEESFWATQKSSQGYLFTNDFHQYPFFSAAIEFPIKDLFPRSKVELTICYRYHHLAPHHLTFHVCISVIFAGIVMAILIHWFMRSEPLQPLIVIAVESAFVIVDEDGRCYMHAVHQQEAFLDSAFADRLFHLWGDVHKSAPGWDIERQFFAVGFHIYLRNEPALI